MRMATVGLDVLKRNISPPIYDSSKEEEAWRFYDVVNCYSYALGLLYDIYYLNPGELSMMDAKSQYTDEEIVERVKSDVWCLGMDIRESSLDEVIEGENCWKIAVMNTSVMDNHSRYDYHFLKQGSNGRWYQKSPYDQFPTQYDSRNRVINDPETASYSYGYHLVGYFVVTKILQI